MSRSLLDSCGSLFWRGPLLLVSLHLFGFKTRDLQALGTGHLKVLWLPTVGVPSISILSRGPNLSRKPPATQGKWPVLEKNDG